MIQFSYTEQGLKVETKDLLYDSLKFKFVRQTTDKLLWEIDLPSWNWAIYPDTEMVDVIVEDPDGNEIYRYEWSVLISGTLFYQKLWKYCLDNPNSKGVVVGTHSGDFGEWVPVADKTDITLVEASDKQFTELAATYGQYPNLTLVNELVTTNGENTLFYEGGEGYTNSVLQRVIEYWETAPITSTIRTSIKFSDLITPDVKWVHLDVEGIDDRLIMSLDDSAFNHIDLIIYEYNNLNDEDREIINNFLIDKGYTTYREGGIGLAEK